MGRIGNKFGKLRAKKEKALVVYLTAGDPSPALTIELILTLAEAGADIVEIGVPFSDPTADGPVIQAASQRALKAGTTLSGVIEMVRKVRRESQIPIVLFSYFNPIFAYGVKRFAEDAKQVGADGILVVDLPPEEAPELRVHTDAAGLDFISLVAPTTGGRRLREIVKSAAGFVYYISITGVTGTAAPEIENIAGDIGKIRRLTKTPVAAGFGISDAAQAGQIGRLADGVVIGSALVRLIDEYRHSDDLMRAVSDCIREIKAALR